MGKLIEYVVAHEVGHTLGFQHNMKASSTYPLARSMIVSGSRRWDTRQRSWITRALTMWLSRKTRSI
jgi:predicted Zn-dependent protease